MTDVLVILFGLTMLYISATGMLGSYVRMLAAQGILLFIIALVNTNKINFAGFLFVAVETLLLKAILIPWFLNKTIRDNEMIREAEPNIPTFFSLLIVSLIFAFGFVLASWSIRMGNSLIPLQFGVSISTMITGMFIIITRKKLITQVMGYMIIENGIFLLTLSAAKEMPVIVSLGVSLDIFMGVLMAGLFINRIKSTFEDHDSDTLTSLKD
jgi:hydrogenase-4 component E